MASAAKDTFAIFTPAAASVMLTKAGARSASSIVCSIFDGGVYKLYICSSRRRRRIPFRVSAALGQ